MQDYLSALQQIWNVIKTMEKPFTALFSLILT